MRLVFPVGAGLVLGFTSLLIIARKNDEKILELTLKSPLDWLGIFRLSIALSAILAVVSFAQLWLGSEATYTISFLTGLFELHGVSLANATLFSQGQLNIDVASLSIFLGLMASLIAKISISWFISPGIFARSLSFIFCSMIGVIIFTAWIAHA